MNGLFHHPDGKQIKNYHDTESYWRCEARIGSEKLLQRLRDEFDANMVRPKSVVKPRRMSKLKQDPAPVMVVVVWPVIPREEPYTPLVVPTVRQIQEAVCNYYRVHRSQLIGPRRTANLMKPRHVAVYLARELTKFSTIQIGRFFGGKDHTCTINSVRRIKHLLPIDEELAFDIATLFVIITGVQQ